MREIKFRAWDKKYKKMYYLKEGVRAALAYPEEDVEWMQFTGLHDKNSKEIYEGDVVYASFNEEKYIVKHGLYRHISIEHDNEMTCYGWYLDHISGSDCFSDSMEGSENTLEVIGNIYENGEVRG